NEVQPQRGCGRVEFSLPRAATLSGLLAIRERFPRVARSSQPLGFVAESLWDSDSEFPKGIVFWRCSPFKAGAARDKTDAPGRPCSNRRRTKFRYWQSRRLINYSIADPRRCS